MIELLTWPERSRVGFEDSTSPLGRHLPFRTPYVGTVSFVGHLSQLHLPY